MKNFVTSAKSRDLKSKIVPLIVSIFALMEKVDPIFMELYEIKYHG